MADTQDLNATLRQRIFSLIAASHGRINLVSGYRSDAEQAQLYAQAVQKYGPDAAGNWVAPPGHSNHNKGLAVDLGGDMDLLHQLAPQFGLEFPMSWEPWHVELVGTREQSGTSPQAYTTGPPGTVNPTQDPTINNQPATLFARFSQALSGNFGYGNEGETGTPSMTQPTTESGRSGAGGSGAAASGNTTTSVAPDVANAGGLDKRLGGTHTITQWAHDILTGLGAPTTPENMQTLETWANTESGGYNPDAAGGRYNPLNTTEGALGYAGQGGSQGDIKDYASYNQGVDAQVYNLTHTKGAGYENILAALRKGNDPQAVYQAVNQSHFGTHFS